MIPRRKLGRTGVEVSALGLGGYHLGIPNEDEATRMIRSAIERGVDFLDNCWDYHDGESERRMGNALRDGYRSRAFLMTKIDGRTRAAAAGQIEQCLERLQTNVIDLMQVHEVIRMEDARRVFEPRGAMEALLDARDRGKIRFIGFTGHKDPAMHLAMLEEADRHGLTFDAVQLPLNVMDHHYHSFETRVLPELLRRDVAVLGMKPLGAGAILRTGAVVASECLQYALSLPTSVVITGCESMDDVDQAVAVGERFHPLDDTARRALLAKTAPLADAGAHEPYKTTNQHDGTAEKPHWLEEARI